VAARVVTYRRMKWAIDSSVPYKSPGMDGIFPALMQEGRRIALPYVVKICHACLVSGYIPAIRCQVNVVFIPKPGRKSGPKDFRLTSLTLFLLKTMERLVARFQGMKFWLLSHYNPVNMFTRLGNPCKWPFISSS